MSKEAPVELRKRELLRWAGGLLDEADAARRLAIGIQELRMRSTSGRLISLTVEGRPGYPACQFDDLGIVPGLEAALHVMPINPTG